MISHKIRTPGMYNEKGKIRLFLRPIIEGMVNLVGKLVLLEARTEIHYKYRGIVASSKTISDSVCM